ncbi:MAG: hypothetical protein RBU30_13450 [Polyangia bacterium]|jgi:hypothetical protein|nr:hypothetical protein [Polyangia bacterium]
MPPLNPTQLSLLPRALDVLLDERQLIGLWLGPERWLRVKDRLVSAYVFFHLKEGGEAVLSIRADDRSVPRRVHGRWWTEAGELVVALGYGEIRARYQVSDGVLAWGDEVLVRRPATSICLEPPAAPRPEIAASLAL